MADDEPTLRDRLPSPLPLYDDSTDFGAWLDAHQTEIDGLGTDIKQTKEQIHVAHATGQELDLIGREYGLLGQRRGRDDDTYRSFLMSLIASFKGVGTVPGVKEAISSGLLVETDDVVLREDFTANKYEVELRDWTAHQTETVHTLADLGDPLAIERLDPIHYIRPETSFGLDPDETTSTTLQTDGLSSSSLQPLSTGGTWDLP